MQVTSNWELPVFQVIGPVVRIHWDYAHTTSEDGGEIWNAQEAVVQIAAGRATFVSIINAQGGNGDELADGWFNQKESSL